ncbi:MAG: DMT family transporter [Alphaproteobacteria bacterium]|nr:DMT family transporter [Rickettsiales bacterium]
MDKLLYLTFCVTNSLFYVLIKYLHLKNPQYIIYEIAAYVNIVSLSLMMPYLIKNFRHVINGFACNLKIAVSAPSSLLKFVAISYISPKNAMVVSFLTPVAVTILSFVTLKEEFKASDLFTKYSWMLLSLCGVVVFIGADFTFSTFAYSLMMMHVLGKAFFHVFTKQLSKDRYLVLFYGILYNCIFSVVMSICHKPEGLNFSFVLNPWVIFIGIISVLCQFALIQSYKISFKISSLQNLDYSRILFSSIATYFLLSEPIKGREYLGIIMIAISVLGSQKSNLKKKAYAILKKRHV